LESIIIPTSADDLSSSVISIEWTKLGPNEIIERPKKVDSVNCKELKRTLMEDSEVKVRIWRAT
jgi:hypothetical protein